MIVPMIQVVFTLVCKSHCHPTPEVIEHEFSYSHFFFFKIRHLTELFVRKKKVHTYIHTYIHKYIYI